MEQWWCGQVSEVFGPVTQPLYIVRHQPMDTVLLAAKVRQPTPGQ